MENVRQFEGENRVDVRHFDVWYGYKKIDFESKQVRLVDIRKEKEKNTFNFDFLKQTVGEKVYMA